MTNAETQSDYVLTSDLHQVSVPLDVAAERLGVTFPIMRMLTRKRPFKEQLIQTVTVDGETHVTVAELLDAINRRDNARTYATEALDAATAVAAA